MAVVECDKLDCPYNFRGFCESEVIEIRNGKCVTLEVEKELFSLEDEEDG